MSNDKIISNITKEELTDRITKFLKELEVYKVATAVVCVHSEGPALGANVPHEVAKAILTAGALTLSLPGGPQLGGPPVETTSEPAATDKSLN